jgi:hypothetical protein
MSRPRLTDEQRKQRGLWRIERSDLALAHGRTRLVDTIPAPEELDADAAAQWDVHLALLIEAGTVSTTSLRGLMELCRLAAGCERAHALARQSGPLVRSKDGVRYSPAWQAWLETVSVYMRWLDRFGLAPMGARHLPVLPTARGAQLREVV